MHVNQDPGIDRSGLQMFTIRRYQADGEVSSRSVALTLGMGMGAGAMFGVLASIAGYYGFYLVFLVPLMMGAGVGAVMSQGVQVTKNRDPWVTATAALAASLVAITAIHVSDYCSFVSDRDDQVSQRDIRDALQIKQGGKMSSSAHRMKANDDPGYVASLQVETFFEFMNWQAEEGVSIGSAGPGAGGGDMNLGYYGSWIYWLMEALVIAGIAASMVWASSSQPFCPTCDRWCDARTLGEMTIDAGRLVSIFEGGNLQGLTREMASSHQTCLKLFRCKNCSSPDQSVIAIERITMYKGQRQVKCMGRFVVPDEGIAWLASFLNSANEEFAVLSAVEELSEDVRLCMSPELSPVARSAGEPDPAVSEYMQQLLDRSANDRRNSASSDV